MNSSPDSKKTKKKKNRFFPIVLKHLVIAGLAFLITGILFFVTMDKIVMPFVLRTGKGIDCPNFVGKTFNEAVKIAKNERVILLADSTEYNDYFPENTIFFQYPPIGTKIKRGRRIFTIKSLGARPIEMPDVVGMSRGDAVLAIKALELEIEKQEWIHSNDYVKGIVARQYPEGSREIPGNTKVTLYISDGEPERNSIMPNLIDLGLSAALDTLRMYNFDVSDTTKIRIQKEKSPELLPETIIDQHPDSGSPINNNDVIDIVVSTIE